MAFFIFNVFVRRGEGDAALLIRWLKRLKWLRISKVVIPVALAVSLIFVGFTVYGHEAEYFVINAGNEDGVRLSLTLNRDLSEQTSRLLVPAGGNYGDVTYDTSEVFGYDPSAYADNLPDDIARHDGVHSVYKNETDLAFYSFSFYLVNNSDRAVNVDYSLTIEEMVKRSGASCHVDEALRVMFIEDEPLLSENTYTIYQKRNKPAEEMTPAEREFFSQINYTNVFDFESENCVFSRTGYMGLVNFPSGGVKRFTVVLWLEGNDPECINDIFGERLRLSLNFVGT